MSIENQERRRLHRIMDSYTCLNMTDVLSRVAEMMREISDEEDTIECRVNKYRIREYDR